LRCRSMGSGFCETRFRQPEAIARVDHTLAVNSHADIRIRMQSMWAPV